MISDLFNRFLEQYISKGKALYYDLYFCRFSDESRISVISHNLQELLQKNLFLTLVADIKLHDYYTIRMSGASIPMNPLAVDVVVRDLSKESLDEQRNTMEHILAAARRKQYNPTQNGMLDVLIIKLKEDDYFAIFSICGQTGCFNDTKEFAQYLFGTLPIETYISEWEKSYPPFNEAHTVQCQAYWQEFFRKEKQYVKSYPGENTQYFLYDVSSLDDNVIKLMKRFIKDYKTDVRSIFVAVWTLILSKYFSVKDFMMNYYVSNYAMKYFPLSMHTGDNQLLEMIRSIDHQIKNSGSNMNCPERIINSVLGMPFENIAPVSFSAFRVDELLDRLMTMGHESLFYLDGFEPSGSRLQINFFFASDSVLAEYYFNHREIMQSDIQSLHNLFDSVLQAVLKQVDETKVKNMLIQQSGDGKAVDASAILDVLRSSPVFESLPGEEFAKLVPKCYFVSNTAEATIFEIGNSVDVLYLIVSGHIEMSSLSIDKVLQPLMILKKGDLFGIEALLTDRVSKNTYRVADEKAMMLAIPSSVFAEVAKSEPELWRHLLSISTDRMNRFAKMWLTQ